MATYSSEQLIHLIFEFVEYDPITGIFTWKPRDRRWFKTDGLWNSWNKRFAGKQTFKTFMNEGYNMGSILSMDLYAHRVAWVLMTGKWPDGEIDHDNGIRTDNRWVNLKDVTSVQNGRNQGIKSSNTSGYTGVSWHASSRKWRASIRVDGKLISLGDYQHKIDAICVRRAAEIKYNFHAQHGKRNSVLEVVHRTNRKTSPV